MSKNRASTTRVPRNRHFYNVATFPLSFRSRLSAHIASQPYREEKPKGTRACALTRLQRSTGNKVTTLYIRRDLRRYHDYCRLEICCTLRGMVGLERFRIRLQREPTTLFSRIVLVR